jgi:hypothetical protein
MWFTNSSWASCSKAIGCWQTKEGSCWQAKKGCNYNIISTRDKELESSKRGKDCHTYKGWWGVVKVERFIHKLVSTSFVASHCCYNNKHGNNFGASATLSQNDIQEAQHAKSLWKIE